MNDLRSDAHFTQYMNGLKKYRITAKEERELLIKYAETKDPKIADKIIKANLLYAAKVAYKYKNNNHLRMMDLIQEANMGLALAIDKFDHTRGFKFISFATYYIENQVRNVVRKNHSIVDYKGGVAARAAYYKYRRMRSQFVAEHHREPNDEEIAKILQCKPSEIKGLKEHLYETDVSLNGPVRSDRETSTFQDLIPDESIQDPGEKLYLDKFSSKLHQIIKDLDLKPKYKFLLENRILAEEPMTLQEVGDHLLLTRERVRQMEQITLNKIKKALVEDGYP